MRIAAVCCTYLRPKQLGQMIRCFQLQDYPAEDRELVILDDAGQYDDEHGDRWRLISRRRRFGSLGQKRNAAVEFVSEGTEALAVWDDDDLYLPWALTASVAALRQAPWSRPSVVLHIQKDGALKQHKTGGLFHGGWAYGREVFEQVGGYPARNNGEDQAFARRLQAAGVQEADPIRLGFRSFYVYRWGAGCGWQLSTMGDNGYQRLGRRQAEHVRLAITDPPKVNLKEPRILPGVFPRVF